MPINDTELARRAALIMAEAGLIVQRLDAAGYADLAGQIRDRLGYLDNAARPAHSRALSEEERRMIAAHFKKLGAMLAQARDLFGKRFTV